MTDITTSWMWAVDSGGVNGVTIDPVHRSLAWFEDIGCACGDSIADQSYDSLLEDGPALGGVPAEILTEITTTVQALKQR